MCKLIAVLFLFALTGCVPMRAAKEIDKQVCLRSISGEVTESGRPDEFVPPDSQWHVLQEGDKKTVFSRLKNRDCMQRINLPMEEKYQLAVRARGELGFEVRVWLTGEDFKE